LFRVFTAGASNFDLDRFVATVLAFGSLLVTGCCSLSDLRESAIIATVPPGNYTAIVRGVNNTTGIDLVEVYDLE
jgi:hypothetical protein